MSSYSCVTARLTMRSVLQTHGDNRSRSGPVIRLVPRPSMAPMLLAMASTHKQLYASTYTLPRGSPRLGIRIALADVPRAEGTGETTHGNDDRGRPTMRGPLQMETMMQGDKHQGDRWFKEAMQQAKKWITGETLLIAGGLR